MLVLRIAYVTFPVLSQNSEEIGLRIGLKIIHSLMIYSTRCMSFLSPRFFMHLFYQQERTAETSLLRQRNFPEPSLIFPSLLCTDNKQDVWKPSVHLIHLTPLFDSVLPQVTLFSMKEQLLDFQLIFSLVHGPSFKDTVPAIS